jgi:hypothetical protein
MFGHISFKVPLKRRHSTGTFIMETESNSCKDGAQFSQNYSKKIYKLSRQFSHENFIQNIGAIKCSRFYSRRNALCDPFRMLIPQHMPEQLEHNVEQRKTSVTRKVVQFITVSLDLDREEECIKKTGKIFKQQVRKKCVLVKQRIENMRNLSKHATYPRGIS